MVACTCACVDVALVRYPSPLVWVVCIHGYYNCIVLPRLMHPYENVYDHVVDAS